MPDSELKIATWNLDRPRPFTRKLKNDAITEKLREIDADILVLTETNSCINLHDNYQTCFSTTCLFQSLAVGKERYDEGENRVTIWSKFSGHRRIDMCNSHSSICALLKCDGWGDLNVYGTVIGIYGRDRTPWDSPGPVKTDFSTAIQTQRLDWERLSGLGNLCVAGDFNTSLQGKCYVSTFGREEINNSFQRLGMEAPTLHIPNNIDHIVLSAGFLKGVTSRWKTWNESQDKKIFSDHMGVCITLSRS